MFTVDESDVRTPTFYDANLVYILLDWPPTYVKSIFYKVEEVIQLGCGVISR